MPSIKVRLNASLTSKRCEAGSEPKLMLFSYGKRALTKSQCSGEFKEESQENGHFDQNVAPATAQLIIMSLVYATRGRDVVRLQTLIIY